MWRIVSLDGGDGEVAGAHGQHRIRSRVARARSDLVATIREGELGAVGEG